MYLLIFLLLLGSCITCIVLHYRLDEEYEGLFIFGIIFGVLAFGSLLVFLDNLSDYVEAKHGDELISDYELKNENLREGLAVVVELYFIDGGIELPAPVIELSDIELIALIESSLEPKLKKDDFIKKQKKLLIDNGAEIDRIQTAQSQLNLKGWWICFNIDSWYEQYSAAKGGN